MKFSVARDVLAEAVSWTARTLPNRPAVAVLAGVRITAADGAVTLSSFDYDTSARTVIEAQVEEPGEVLVSGKLLAEICKALPAQPVAVALAGTRVNITCGNANFTVVTMPVDDYPDLPQLPPVSGRIAAAELQKAVAQVALASSREDTLPILTTVRLEINGENLALLATDRYRLAMRELSWQPADAQLQTAALVKARTLTEMTKSLVGGGDVEISLSAEGASAAIIGVESGGRRMTSNLTDGDYPPVRSLFPEDTSIHAVVSRVGLVEAVKRMALVANRDDPIRLTFNTGELVLEAGQGENAQASEAIAASFDGSEAITTAFNPAYLLDGLGALETEYVRLSFTHPSKPAIITGQEQVDGEEATDYRYLLMPIRYGL